MDTEKALDDLVNFHKNQYSIDLVIEKFLEFKNDLDLSRLTAFLSKFPVTTIRIFGFIFDLLNIDSRHLYSLVKPVGTHWMLPGDTKFNSKWRLYYQADFDKYQTK